jgi:hypothetical protein
LKVETLALPCESRLRVGWRRGIGFHTRYVIIPMQISALVLFTYGKIALRLEFVGRLW